MHFDPVAMDPVRADPDYPASRSLVRIESSGSGIYGSMLVAQGPGPHPVVLLLSGFPGGPGSSLAETAAAIQRAGGNALVFHHRGLWGSEGVFSVPNAIEDARAALAFLRTSECQTKFRCASVRTALIGHSFGSFLALLIAAGDTSVAAAGAVTACNPGVWGARAGSDGSFAAELAASIDGGLRFARTELAADDIVRHFVECAHIYDLLRYADALADRAVLMVGALRDQMVPVDQHHEPLARMLQARSARLRHIELDTGHNMIDKQVTVRRLTLSWLQEEVWGLP